MQKLGQHMKPTRVKRCWKTAFLPLVVNLCVFGMFATTAYAYADEDFSNVVIQSAEGLYTVLTDTQGEEHRYAGAIDPQSIEQSGAAEMIASYQVLDGDEEILSVKLNDIESQPGFSFFGMNGVPASNGYYSVKFELSPEENTEAFLTGLYPVQS